MPPKKKQKIQRKCFENEKGDSFQKFFIIQRKLALKIFDLVQL